MQDLGITPAERLASEIELLEAMFPDQVRWDPTQSRELRFVHSNGGDLVLRLPDRYPEIGLPTLIGATTVQKKDLRLEVKSAMVDMNLHDGEEVLDTIVQCYQDVVVRAFDQSQLPGDKIPLDQSQCAGADEAFKVVVIWLHHLLATGKRKLALDPTLNSGLPASKLCGITKPGYPGVMVFSGPCSLIDAHVAELKYQRWQAFQVRLEEKCDMGKAWKFLHGDGIKEFESMSDVVQNIAGKDKQEAFLKAIGVK